MPGAMAPGTPLSASQSVARLIHDLHGPLTVIRGLCATLVRDEADPGRRRALALIDGETLRLAAGLAGLYGAPESRVGTAPATSPMDLAALVTATGERFSAIAESSGLELSTRVTGAPVWVDADAEMIERVIDNLVRNAVRHCAPGRRVEIALGVRRRRAVVRVRDQGAGVPVCDRERIFAPGYRGSRPRGDGRGLGLAIAREIAEAHGGRLTLDSVGAGACFRLCLPLLGDLDHGPRAA